MSLNLDKATWKRVRLGDVIRRSRTQASPTNGDVDRYVGGGHIDSESLTIERFGDVNDGQMGSTFTYVFQPGQILFVSARPYLRKSGVVNFSGVVADKTYVLDTIPENGLLQEFLPFVLASDHFIAYATAEATGSMNPRLLWGQLQRYEFDLPPLDEQQRLVDLLWAIERHRVVVPVAPLLSVEAGILRSLTVNQAGESRVISDLGTVLMGRQRSPQHATGDHMMPYLRVANVGDNELRMADVRKMNFTPSEQKTYSLQPGDILVSEGQSRELVGQSALVKELPELMCFQNTLIRFRADPKIIRPEYAQAVFRSLLLDGTFADVATQTTSIAHLGVKRFAGIQVMVPGLAEQDDFLAQFTNVRSGIKAAKQEKDALTQLRQVLLSDIFGGID
jgi:type I restriction enzyme, S subunit